MWLEKFECLAHKNFDNFLVISFFFDIMVINYFCNVSMKYWCWCGEKKGGQVKLLISLQLQTRNIDVLWLMTWKFVDLKSMKSW